MEWWNDGISVPRQDLLFYKKTAPRFVSGRRCHEVRSANEILDDLDVFGFGAFGCLFDLKADSLAFSQGFEAFCLNGSVMDEKILPILLLDEAIALLLVEPLHRSFAHCDIPPFYTGL